MIGAKNNNNNTNNNKPEREEGGGYKVGGRKWHDKFLSIGHVH